MAIEKVTYCLNGTVAAFAHWISERTQSECPRKFPTGYTQGHYVLQPVQLPSQRIGQRPLTLEMTWSYVPESAGAKAAPPESWAIRFKIEPLLPRKGQIEVTVECNHYPVMDYFEQLLIGIGWAFPAMSGGNEAKRTKATIERIQAITERMEYKSSLELEMKAALGELSICLREFHSMLSGEEWLWETVPTLGETRSTRLEVRTDGVSCLGGQIWYVEALDVHSDDDLGTPFCIISASPLRGRSDNSRLNVNCWPDWSKGHTPLSYREYLTALLGESQQRGIIKHLPKWLTEPERTEPPLPGEDGETDETVLRLGKPGRKPDPLYDKAYQWICNGESPEDAFAWFCNEAKITKPDKGTRDAFKAAIKRRQNKT
ncbi:MAG: hypothetical protein SXV54_08705 [Chloroflexota bacterium]|nr:hypothetical protein [Chloroflexota bacterium]